jgi:putative phosphoesterase
MSYNYIGIIGDVHCEDRLLEKAVDILIAKNSEKIICTGDIADGKGDFDKCINILERHDIKTIRGNHADWLLTNTMRSLTDATMIDDVNSRSINYLKNLSKTQNIQSSIGDILLCHGLGDNDMAKLTPDDYGYALEANLELQKIISDNKYSIVISGHTHRRMVRDIGNCKFLNAGSF